jgi:hypothetical protein
MATNTKRGDIDSGDNLRRLMDEMGLLKQILADLTMDQLLAALSAESAPSCCTACKPIPAR